MLLDMLRRLVPDVAPIEELIAGRTVARAIKGEFEEIGEDVPSWLEDKLRQLNRAIDMKLDEKRALELREIDKELERLTPAAERRVALEKKRRALLKRQQLPDKVGV